jgi:hypothetical protein
MASTYDTDTYYNLNWDNAEEVVVVNKLKQMIKENDKILDMGCGTGLFLKYFTISPNLYTGN